VETLKTINKSSFPRRRESIENILWIPDPNFAKAALGEAGGDDKINGR